MFTKLANARMISTAKRLRFILAVLFCVVAMAIVVVKIPSSRGATPASGSVSESNPKVTWTGQIKPPSGSSDCGGPNNSGCDNFGVNFQAPASSFGPYLLEIKLQPQGDWDMQVYGPNGNLVDGSGNSPGVLELVTLINPPSGTYVVSAAPFAPLAGTDTNSYAASIELKHYFANPATQGSDTNITYHNFAAPGSMGNDSGEPTIGVNWKTGRAMILAGTETLRVTFDDATVPARATWEDKSYLWTGVITMDPILFTDRSTGRTIVSQLMTPAAANSLAVLTDGCSLSAVTDDDGDTWVPDEGCGPPSGADHQSIGGGPFADPLPRELPAPAYAHAVYYCAQSGVTAYCSRSDDGGLTYGPGVPIYTSECSGLHGHPMVAPDGTVYVPNKSCGGSQGVVVSEDNGVTWSVRPVPDSLQGAGDPGVAIGAQGTVYFGYQNGDGIAKVAVSHDKGLTWTASKDVGAAFGLKNSSFPRVVAGDDDRAAFAFLGTPTGGPFQDANFQGEWHLYIAHTFDSGQTWTTIDATPTDPVQRGCIWMQGGSNPCRNLLDFMGEAVDKEGRVLVGYADGCLNCSDPSTSHAKKATIARQVNGRRLFATYDPVGDPSPTPTPVASPTPTPQPGSNVLHFHGNPTDDTGFTGLGMVDVVAAGGPFLDTRDALGTTVPAHWDVPDPVTSGTADQNIYDPSWIWVLNSPTTLNGPMTVKWWASCSGCSAAADLNANWTIRLWADGVKVFEQTVTNVTPDLPNVPQLLQATVTVPTVTASTKFVLHVDPVFVDGQVNTHIYYDSQAACPGATGSEPCDSTVTMPIVGASSTPTPTPTPDGSPTPTPSATPTPTPSPSGCPANDPTSFSIHMSPPGYGDSWGEPSIGVNWKTEQVFNGTPNGGTVLSFGGFGDGAFPDVTGLRIIFNDTNPAAPTATWEHTASMAITGAPRAAGDPILYTDHQTGRTFFTQLLGLTPLGSTTQFTDDDGRTFTASEGSGLPSGVDHETFGGGPLAPPLTGGTPVYQNAVYYCSQSVADATCSVSLDGGMTFGPGVPIYGVNDCTGLHGHIKVGPDGTAYVPNKGCGGSLPYHEGSQQAVIVSENNGLTWTIRPVTTSTGNGNTTKSDPAVGIGADGTVYFGYQANDGHAHIAVSKDKGQTWISDTDAGAQLGIQNAVFPAVVAGDGDRAAYAFFGTTTGGTDFETPTFAGVWYLFIATTYDGGQTWTTVNATPGDPIQRGGICGSSDPQCRNLLDFFDATIDKEGRVLIGYDDGCISAACIAGTSGNDFTAKNAIARQLSGRRMFAAYDTCGGPTPTPTPTVTPTPTPTPTATPTPTPTATPTPGQAPPAATFGHNTLADFSAVGGEPFIRVDKQDNIFVSSPFGVSTTVSLLWKSTDHGRTFIPLGTPIVRDAVTGPGGGDTHMDFDDRNRLYYVDLSAACTTAAVSEDGGNTFPLDRNNPLTCIGGGSDPEGATDDRQWVAAFGDGIAYSTVRNLAVAVGSGNFHLSKTTDAGKTWTAQIIGNVGQSGPLEVDKTKRSINVNGTRKDAILLYQIYYTGSTLKLIRIADLNDGSPFIIDDLTIPTPGSSSVATVFPVLSIDKAGNLYAVWSDGAKIKMAASTDRGDHWTAPAQVNPTSMTGMNIMPWIVAGDPGRVDIIWYHTAGGNDANARWDIQMAQTLDALSGNPAFTTNQVNENTIHTGEICLEGLNCDIDTLAGTPRDRSFAEFPSIDIDSHGAAYITYNDSNNQLPAPYVMVARQTGGASLFASVGSINGAGGTVTISQPAPGDAIRTASMILSGTHTLAPKNFDRDENADATFPDHGAVIGSNIPALDLKSVSLSDDATSVTVTMQVADLSTTALATAPAQSGGDGVLYLTQMHSGNRVFWVGAEFRAGQARFLTGDLGSINSSTAKKYITYNPDAVNSLSVQGSVTNTAPGTITMKIPRSLLGNPANGTVFTSVTGYAFSERGPLAPAAGGTPNITSLPIQVDTAGALTYTVGDGAPQLNGVVEVSIDDPNFTSPRVAAIGDAVNTNTWSLQLSGSDLVVGAHTAYVRQRVNGGAPSPLASVAFTVSATIEQPVTSLVSLASANARTSSGVSSYDLTIKNTSTATIYAPMRIEVASITSASGRVTVANADNGMTGAGAAWDYSTKLGADNALLAAETSAARNLRFNNPNNEAFTVSFNVVGNLDRAAAGGSASSTSGGSGGGSASSGTSSTTSTTTMLYSLTYNPLLNTVTSKLIKP